MQIERLEDFIANMPKSLSTNTEKARWLYIELGKRSFYDVSYGFLNEDEEQELMYDHKNYKNPNIITCTSLTDQYEKLLKIIGIESKVITDGGHRYLRFYEEDGITWHTADLTNDLKNVQSGCQTSHFLQIDSEKLRDIDKRIGYISEKKGYTDDYFEQVKDFIIKKGLKGKAQLEYILEVFHLYVKPEKMGEHELYSMYQKFIKTCIQEEKIPSFTATMRKGKKHSSQPKSKFGTKPGLVEYNMTFVDENNVAFEYILNLQTGKFQEVGTKEMYHSNYQIKGIRCKRKVKF